MVKKYSPLLAFSALIIFAGRCLPYGAGTDGAPFLSINPGAVSMGMGGSGMACGMAGESIFLNPAATYLAHGRKQATYTHVDWLNDVDCEYVSYVHGTKKIGVFGAGLTVLHMPEIDVTNRAGIETHEIVSVGDNMLLVSYANKIAKGIFFGTSVKGIYRNIGSVWAGGLAMDAGFLYYGRKNYDSAAGDYYDISAGISVRNLLATTVSFYDYNYADKLLPVLKLGLGYKPLKEITLACDLDILTDRRMKLHTGAEFWVSDNVAFRAGYDSSDDLGAGSGLCTGFSFRPSKKSRYKLGLKSKTTMVSLQVDYALRFAGDMGMVHRIATKMNFDGRMGKLRKKLSK